MATLYKLGILFLALVVLAACSGGSPPVQGAGGKASQGAEATRAARSDPEPTAPAGQEPAAPVGQEPTAPAGQEPTAAPEPTRQLPERRIVLESPTAGQAVSSPAQVSGWVSMTPFEANLVGRVYDEQGQVIGESPVMVQGELGESGTFTGSIPFAAAAAGAGRIELVEESAKDGSIVASAAVDVTLQSQQSEPAGAVVELPAAGARATLPLHILARFDRQPGEQLTVAVRWENGVELAHSLPLLHGEDGQALLIGSLNWLMESEPPQPRERAATFEIRDQAGAVLAQQPIEVLHWEDQEAQQVKLYWLLGEQLQESTRRVPQTRAIGTAALEELLWGPDPANLAGFETAIPTPQEVLGFAGREPDWGARVRLLGLTIEDGVATANFSQELRAYGGGALRASLIEQQITRTLQQFSTVSQVRIAIEGQVEGALQP